MNKTQYANSLIERFKQHSHLEQAAQMRAYVKDKFYYYGIKAPLRKELTKQHLKANGLLPFEDAVWLIKHLWLQPNRELHYVAMELFFRYKKEWQPSDIELLEYLVIENSWWDTVDYVASTLIGEYFKKYPEQIDPITTMWRGSENMWLIRSCIIFQLKYKEQIDKHLLEQVILENNHSKEFFIQKAIGWSLRQYSRFNPDWVKHFVDKTELKPLSKREALRLMI